MTSPRPRPYITLGLYPTSRGFGWVAFDGPFTLFDSGLFTAMREKNAACLRKVNELVERLSPETLVMESFDKRSSTRSERIRRLCTSIVSLAADRGLELAVFTRGNVKECFASVGARSRYEIAEAIARHVGGLQHRMPKSRAYGDSEDKRLAIFNAAAVVLTHYHYGTSRLFDDLRHA